MSVVRTSPCQSDRLLSCSFSIWLRFLLASASATCRKLARRAFLSSLRSVRKMDVSFPRRILTAFVSSVYQTRSTRSADGCALTSSDREDD